MRCRKWIYALLQIITVWIWLPLLTFANITKIKRDMILEVVSLVLFGVILIKWVIPNINLSVFGLSPSIIKGGLIIAYLWVIIMKINGIELIKN